MPRPRIPTKHRKSNPKRTKKTMPKTRTAANDADDLLETDAELLTENTSTDVLGAMTALDKIAEMIRAVGTDVLNVTEAQTAAITEAIGKLVPSIGAVAQGINRLTQVVEGLAKAPQAPSEDKPTPRRAKAPLPEEVKDPPKPKPEAPKPEVMEMPPAPRSGTPPVAPPTPEETKDALLNYAKKNGREALIALFQEFGGAKLSDISPEKIPALVAKALEG